MFRSMHILCMRFTWIEQEYTSHELNGSTVHLLTSHEAMSSLHEDTNTRQVYHFTRHCENSIDPKRANPIVDTHIDLQQPSHETEHENSSSAHITIHGTYAYFGPPGRKKHEVERGVEPGEKP